MCFLNVPDIRFSMKNIKGILFIVIGASSYGVLATFMKMANNRGLSTGVLTISQYALGLSLVFLASRFLQKKKTEPVPAAAGKKDSIFKMVLFGTSLGITSSLYYMSIRYVPVSVSIVLLMQSIWIGLVFEFFIDRRLLTGMKIAGACTTIAGTLLAVNIFDLSDDVQWQGIALGLGAAVSFATTMLATNRVGLHLPAIERTKYLVFGGLIVVLIFWNLPGIRDFGLSDFDGRIVFSWGLFLAFFGTVLPPFLFSRGFPATGVGLGSILASMELPVSVFSAWLLLHEQVKPVQWAGIMIILISVTLVNRNNKS